MYFLLEPWGFFYMGVFLKDKSNQQQSDKSREFSSSMLLKYKSFINVKILPRIKKSLSEFSLVLQKAKLMNGYGRNSGCLCVYTFGFVHVSMFLCVVLCPKYGSPKVTKSPLKIQHKYRKFVPSKDNRQLMYSWLTTFQ